ncbi:MAG: type II toxin-antitoxin system VapC family toxin [Bacteroidales bacterium]|nr:type II toxin-antitoxin system VapC family toxin [Bacteroidales bacterium]MCF8343492.1 type II toxin-antitoxin system VapC family toxin [Bacteroidales bacterium]MCF8352110.1 type II toxin-antitoxin system VapC family toxin [Bacteroidales bacterium]MCF8376933.1 type II toxin-antitoxin system VapC family toxin [Bacteroidales bacterium]MCF8402133.1 type II toxin-antitoxin system VapC family toxin [Bacteroidales bacterium]
MNYLIDTHILLWYIVGDNRIKTETKNILEDSSNALFFSNVSLWEIAIKINIGKLKLKGTLFDLKLFLEDTGIAILEFDFFDLQTLQQLPFYHQDPFDRLIVAQGKTKEMDVITNDPQIKKYLE